MATADGATGTPVSTPVLAPARERQTQTVAVVFSKRRLGMFLEPSDDDLTGATVRHFEFVDDAVGEAEASGVIRRGYRIDKIDGGDYYRAEFPVIISAIVGAPRPLTIVFRDPDVFDFRDRFGFPRQKLHVEREAAYYVEHAAAMKRSDLEWLAFLSDLGAGRGSGYGVQRLLRDAVGDVVFPVDPFVRLNAMSPLHGRMEGISGAAAAKPAAGKPAASAKGAAPDARAGPAAAGAAAAPEPPPPAAAIDIYHRCWGVGSTGGGAGLYALTTFPIGVPLPPGLGVRLPGEVPKPKPRQAAADTLRRLVLYGGCPAAFRAAIWFELSGAHAKAALHPPGYYASLTAMRPDAAASYAIAKDVDRTFPGHAAFESPAGLAALQRLLSAFAVHSPEIGYCQSLNFTAGFLLLLLGEEQAFWVLEVLCNDILPPSYYNNGLMGVFGDQRVLAHLVDELMPDVSEAIQRATVQLQTVTVEWFMCLFCTTMPAHAAMRMWDALFVCGIEAVFRVALCLFKQHRSRLLSVATSSTSSAVSVQVQPGTGAGAAASSLPAGRAGDGGYGASPGRAPSSSSSATAASSLPPLATPMPVVRITSTGAAAAAAGAPTAAGAAGAAAAAASAAAADSSSGIATSSSARGVGQDSLQLEMAIGATVAAALLSTADSAAGAATTAATSASSDTPSSPPASSPLSPSFRGGTVRAPAATFAALYNMLKGMPGSAAAFDIDALLRQAYPPTPKEAAAKGALPLDTHVTNARIAKLRSAARSILQAEMKEVQTLRRERAVVLPPSALVSAAAPLPAAPPAAAIDAAATAVRPVPQPAVEVDVTPPSHEAVAAVVEAEVAVTRSVEADEAVASVTEVAVVSPPIHGNDVAGSCTSTAVVAPYAEVIPRQAPAIAVDATPTAHTFLPAAVDASTASVDAPASSVAAVEVEVDGTEAAAARPVVDLSSVELTSSPALAVPVSLDAACTSTAVVLERPSDANALSTPTAADESSITAAAAPTLLAPAAMPEGDASSVAAQLPAPACEEVTAAQVPLPSALSADAAVAVSNYGVLPSSALERQGQPLTTSPFAVVASAPPSVSVPGDDTASPVEASLVTYATEAVPEATTPEVNTMSPVPLPVGSPPHDSVSEAAVVAPSLPAEQSDADALPHSDEGAADAEESHAATESSVSVASNDAEILAVVAAPEHDTSAPLPDEVWASERHLDTSTDGND